MLIVVLMGVSGSGKSTIGRRLAPSLAASFIEGDDYHPSVNIVKMRSGIPLDDRDRWPWLAKLGRAIGLRARSGRSVVAACSALRQSYRAALRKEVRLPLVFVHLTQEAGVVVNRMQARQHHFMPTLLLSSQFGALEPLGNNEDGVTIAGGSVQATVQAIRRSLRLRGRVPEQRRRKRPLRLCGVSQR